MEYNKLLANVKDQLRASIQTKMQQPSAQAIREFLNVQERPELADRQALANETAFLLNNAIDRCITNIMALGYNETFDAAVDDMFKTRGAWGGFRKPRKDVIQSLTYELKLCANAFGPEIEFFTRMHKLVKSGLSSQEVWSQIKKSLFAQVAKIDRKLTAFESGGKIVVEKVVKKGPKISVAGLFPDHGRIPNHVLDQIRHANDIVDVIGQRLPNLKRAGSTFKTLCPFHKEKTPSFTVNQQMQLFKCFGCGVGGDVIKFVMLWDRLEFREAVESLARHAGCRVAKDVSAEERARIAAVQKARRAKVKSEKAKKTAK